MEVERIGAEQRTPGRGPAGGDATRGSAGGRHDRAPARAPRGRDRPVAALDLGTNNCRLLVARPAETGFTVIDAFSRIVRLGEGVGAEGRLSAAAMDRTLAALRVCAGKIRRRGVVASRAVATEACRRAGNFEDFRARVRAETGLRLEVITAAEEARLALTGCAPLLDPGVDYALVFDIGGGSTEVMWMETGGCDRPPAALDSVSLPVGVMSLAERHGGDRIAEEVYESIVEETVAQLGGFERRHAVRRHIAEGRVQMIGSSGTVTTLAGVLRDLPRYDRSVIDGSYLDFCAARDISRRLRAMDYAARAAHPCIGRQRADLVVAGCAILEAICAVWPVGRLRIADRGVREGILFDLITAPARPRGGPPSAGV
ncbi:MAG: Ppx/GppA phosphatase family protein [Azospirillaceae bacterium]